MGKSGGLTPKQEKFCLEYVKDFNATKAAQRAGYGKNPNSYASKLLQTAAVSARVRELSTQVRKKALLEAEDALRWAMDIARSDIYELVTINDDGAMSLQSNDTVRTKYRRGVSELSFSKSDSAEGSSESCKVRMHEKGTALKLIFQHLKLVGDDRPTDVNQGIDPVVHGRVLSTLERIRKRRGQESV